MKNRLYVNVYEVGRAYGGPEEGGWWVDTGKAIGSIPVELTDDEWTLMRDKAIAEGVLVYNKNWDMFLPHFDSDTHTHTEWCEPNEYDKDRDGNYYDFSPRCNEVAWKSFWEARIRDKAQRVRNEWEAEYAPTGNRSSVLGGEDYEVRIQDHFAADFPTVWPHYE